MARAVQNNGGNILYDDGSTIKVPPGTWAPIGTGWGAPDIVPQSTQMANAMRPYDGSSVDPLSALKTALVARTRGGM